jgi:pimeloyl-ACP methyl ester carboxylesterase
MMQEVHPRGEPQIRMLVSQFKNFAGDYKDVNFTPPYLSQITAPTLIIHGDRDQHFPIDIPVTSYKHIPTSYLWIVPNFTHSGIRRNSIWGEAFLGAINQLFSGSWAE